jgi:hypothetical protein
LTPADAGTPDAGTTTNSIEVLKMATITAKRRRSRDHLQGSGSARRPTNHHQVIRDAICGEVLVA